MKCAALAFVLATSLVGCQFDTKPTGGPAYTIDTSQFGTDQAITLRNDNQYWDGMPVDAREHK
jgi:hypothetical protein